MPSIFPKNHLSKDPQTCNALIGQMRLNMHGIKCMGCCSARSALSCSSDGFILRSHRSQVQQKRSGLLDGSPGGPLLSSLQSFSDKTWRLQKKPLQVWRSKESMLNSSRNNHFHLSMCKEREGEGEGRQKAAGCNITTLQHSVATWCKQYYLHRKRDPAPHPSAGTYSLWDPGRVT